MMTKKKTREPLRRRGSFGAIARTGSGRRPMEMAIALRWPSAMAQCLDNGIQMIYTNTEEEKCLMLRIESLEIDDHILDKIESKHSISFQEVEERHVYQGNGMSGEAGKGYTSSLAKRRLDDMSW